MTDTEKLQTLKGAVEKLLQQPAIDVLYAKDAQLWLLLLLMPKLAKAVTAIAKSILELEEALDKINEYA
jgi:hypothetical protein